MEKASTPTHKRVEYTLVKRKLKVRNNIRRDESLSQTINSIQTFTNTNPEIKKNHNLIKTVSTIKTERDSQINHLLTEDDLKREKDMLKKNN